VYVSRLPSIPPFSHRGSTSSIIWRTVFRLRVGLLSKKWCLRIGAVSKRTIMLYCIRFGSHNRRGYRFNTAQGRPRPVYHGIAQARKNCIFEEMPD